MADDNTFDINAEQPATPENPLNTGNGEAPTGTTPETPVESPVETATPEPVVETTPPAVEASPEEPNEIKLDSLASSTPDAEPEVAAENQSTTPEPAPVEEAVPTEEPVIATEEPAQPTEAPETPAAQAEEAPAEPLQEEATAEDLDKKLEEQLENVDNTKNSKNTDKPGKAKFYILIAVIAFAVIAVGYAGYYLFLSGDSEEDDVTTEEDLPELTNSFGEESTPPGVSSPFENEELEEIEELEELDNLVDSIENQIADSENTYEEAVLEETEDEKDDVPGLTGEAETSNEDSEEEPGLIAR